MPADSWLLKVRKKDLAVQGQEEECAHDGRDGCEEERCDQRPRDGPPLHGRFRPSVFTNDADDG